MRKLFKNIYLYILSYIYYEKYAKKIGVKIGEIATCKEDRVLGLNPT